MVIRKAVPALLLMGAFTAVNAEICKHAPGSVICGKGTVSTLSGNGMVTVKGTRVEGATKINGMLNATDANFSSINVNGSSTLFQCTVNQDIEIKGALKASSTNFEKSLDIFSSTVRFINSNLRGNLQIHRMQSKTQKLYLDNHSKVNGDIIFDNGHGKVYIRSGSKVVGKIIGGEVITD
jgi:hypothetical protein